MKNFEEILREERNFVKVELGSRGEVEDVELVKSSYELIDGEFRYKYDLLSEDEDELEYLKEFGRINIDLDKGEVEYGFSEEDCTFYVEYDKNVELCVGLLKCWEDDDLDNGFYELIGNLGC
jgi:hypothetical protein